MAFSISHNTPATGYIAWADVNIQYKGQTYAIPDGNTNLRYVYWLFSDPNSFYGSDEVPELGIDDLLVFYNRSGTALVVPTATVVDGGLIVPGSIIADALAANSVTSEKILAGAVDANAIAANAIGAGAIAAEAIQAEHISAGAVSASAIAADAVGAGAIAAGAIAADHIQSGVINTNHISAAGLDADVLKAGTITVDGGVNNVSSVEVKRSGTLRSLWNEKSLTFYAQDGMTPLVRAGDVSDAQDDSRVGFLVKSENGENLMDETGLYINNLRANIPAGLNIAPDPHFVMWNSSSHWTRSTSGPAWIDKFFDGQFDPDFPVDASAIILALDAGGAASASIESVPVSTKLTPAYNDVPLCVSFWAKAQRPSLVTIKCDIYAYEVGNLLPTGHQSHELQLSHDENTLVELQFPALTTFSANTESIAVKFSISRDAFESFASNVSIWSLMIEPGAKRSFPSFNPYVPALTPFSGTVVEYGSNLNGFYQRFSNGMQICWINQIELVHDGSTSISAWWTFPASFNDENNIFATWAGRSGQAIPQGERQLYHRVISTSTTQCRLQALGDGGFSPGDSGVAQAYAIGTWGD